MIQKRFPGYVLVPFTLLLSILTAAAWGGESSGSAHPWISIIIDDLGYRRIDDRNALELPGPLAYAIMPHSPHAEWLSRLADESGKDVLLHLPMEAAEEEKNRFLGPGALTLSMNRRQFIHTLYDDLGSFPHIIGVNNHMGSLLTRHPDHMEWLMTTLRSRNMFYIDSVTSTESVASSMARKNSVPYLRRDVFLDNKHNEEYINAQFDELLSIARKRGRAIAIGHPHPETIAVLQQRLAELDREGVVLISLRAMFPESVDESLPFKLTRHP